DGAGVDAGKVKATAVQLGLLAPEKADALGNQEAVSLIFHPGVSTSPIITDISGRGLGLAIVKEKVEKLNGALSVETVPGKGTTFRLLNLATVRHRLSRTPTIRPRRVAGNLPGKCYRWGYYSSFEEVQRIAAERHSIVVE